MFSVTVMAEETITLSALGWWENFFTADISQAFLQGRPREEQLGRDKLYMEQPREKPLPGCLPGQLIEVIKGVFGLPDAPRGWWLEFSGTMYGEFQFVSHTLDVAFFIWRHDNGSIGILLVVHVDDVACGYDGSKETQQVIDRLLKRYPFGDLKYLKDHPEDGVNYTGLNVKKAEVNGEVEFRVNQTDFVNGRLEAMKIPKERRQCAKEDCNPIEKSEFKSGCGGLNWVAGRTRMDAATITNFLQKRQAKPSVEDLITCSKAIKEVKASAEVALRVQKMPKDAVVGIWTDSALFNAEGEEIEDDAALNNMSIEDRKKIRSQAGAVVAIFSAEESKHVGPVKISILDWRTGSTKRLVLATFSAETQAAIDHVGMGIYARAFICEVWHGPQLLPTQWKEEHMELHCMTDCKSLYDHLAKDAKLPSDRHTALHVAALRQLVGAGPQRDWSKAVMRWVASRAQIADPMTKPGLSKLCREIMERSTTLFHEESAQALKRKRKELEMQKAQHGYVEKDKLDGRSQARG